MAALPDKEDVQLTMSDDVGLLSGCSTVVELRSVEALAAAEAGDAANQGEARRKIGEKTAARNRERAAWDRVHGRQDPELFRTEILPFLGRVSAREIAEGDRPERQLRRRSKSGKHVPDPMHWDRLREFEASESGIA